MSYNTFVVSGQGSDLGENMNKSAPWKSTAGIAVDELGRFTGHGQDTFGDYSLRGIWRDGVVHFRKVYSCGQRTFYYLLTTVGDGNEQFRGLCVLRKDWKFFMFNITAVFEATIKPVELSVSVHGWDNHDWTEAEELFELHKGDAPKMIDFGVQYGAFV